MAPGNLPSEIRRAYPSLRPRNRLCRKEDTDVFPDLPREDNRLFGVCSCQRLPVTRIATHDGIISEPFLLGLVQGNVMSLREELSKFSNIVNSGEINR